MIYYKAFQSKFQPHADSSPVKANFSSILGASKFDVALGPENPSYATDFNLKILDLCRIRIAENPSYRGFLQRFLRIFPQITQKFLQKIVKNCSESLDIIQEVFLKECILIGKSNYTILMEFQKNLMFDGMCIGKLEKLLQHFKVENSKKLPKESM